jgi:hypothetical protein
MAATGQTKTSLPYLLNVDSVHLLYASALSRTPAIESTHFSPSHRVLKYTCVGEIPIYKSLSAQRQVNSTVRSILLGPI